MPDQPYKTSLDVLRGNAERDAHDLIRSKGADERALQRSLQREHRRDHETPEQTLEKRLAKLEEFQTGLQGVNGVKVIGNKIMGGGLNNGGDDEGALVALYIVSGGQTERGFVRIIGAQVV